MCLGVHTVWIMYHLSQNTYNCKYWYGTRAVVIFSLIFNMNLGLLREFVLTTTLFANVGSCHLSVVPAPLRECIFSPFDILDGSDYYIRTIIWLILITKVMTHGILDFHEKNQQCYLSICTNSYFPRIVIHSISVYGNLCRKMFTLRDFFPGLHVSIDFGLENFKIY